MNQEMKLAVLIDAENISSKYIDVILSEANNLGDVIYKRIYGNWTTPQMASWRNTILDNAIQPIQQYSNTIRKNSSDSALIIDTMDLLYQSNLDGFCIVSSDSDFTRLASRLRESQKYVLGMGESKTPRSFISACNKFLYLDVLWEEAEEAEEAEEQEEHETAEHETAPAAHAEEAHKPGRTTPVSHNSETNTARPPQPPEANPQRGKTPGKDFSTIRQALIKLTEENSDDNGWIFSGTLGNLLSKQFSDFDVRNFGYKKFVPFIESLKLFDVNTFTDEKNHTVKHNYFKLKQTPKQPRRTFRPYYKQRGR
ncbi:NYN domain-containing protein [uncultured Megasphaera sp.]|uniref:NYN domain-containing protein n=1 Tax=uncultured Megasphaera sp. TaxID=165188 RepID=UPI0025E8AE22|nr:NYN domain-containing protein [uncultured Megasphaera sp.]